MCKIINIVQCVYPAEVHMTSGSVYLILWSALNTSVQANINVMLGSMVLLGASVAQLVSALAQRNSLEVSHKCGRAKVLQQPADCHGFPGALPNFLASYC